jgi:2-iminobutanoate/2-iminopropanoate deaminase
LEEVLVCYDLVMKSKVSSDNAPKADHILSQGIVSNEVVYVAGQIHSKPDGTMVEGSVEEKVKQIMQNIAAILEAADAGLDSIVKAVIYVTDMSQMPKLNEVYPTYFKEPYPVREAVCVKELPLGATIEISVVAEK